VYVVNLLSHIFFSDPWYARNDTHVFWKMTQIHAGYWNKYGKLMLGLIYTFKPAHAVNSVKQSLVLKGHIFLVLWENSILIEPLLRGHLSYKVTFSLSQRWPLNTGLTVLDCIVLIIVTWCSILWPFIVGWLCFQYRDIDFWLFKEFHENQ
jgi:hypothetical protein